VAVLANSTREGGILGSKSIVDDLHRTERGKHEARDGRMGQRWDIN